MLQAGISISNPFWGAYRPTAIALCDRISVCFPSTGVEIGLGMMLILVSSGQSLAPSLVSIITLDSLDRFLTNLFAHLFFIMLTTGLLRFSASAP